MLDLGIGGIQGIEPVTLIKGILVLFMFSAAVSYIIHHFTHGKFVLPGDLYKVQAPRRIYIPFGSTLIITIGLYVILTSKLLGVILSLGLILVAYKAMFKK